MKSVVMLKHSLIVFSILLFSFSSYAQDCGRGTYTISFIPKGKVNFKLFSLVPKNFPLNEENSFNEFQKWFSKVFPQFNLKNTYTYCCHITQIKRRSAENFLSGYKENDFKSLKELNNLPNKLEGSSAGNLINFKTIETLNYPTLLNISSEKYGEFYFIGVFLGGCDRSDTFDLRNRK